LITTIIVDGINNTNKLAKMSDSKDNTGLRFDKNNNVLFPNPPTIIRDTLAKRKVVVSLSPAFRDPTIIPNTTNSV